MRILLAVAVLVLLSAPDMALAAKSHVGTSKLKHRLNIYSVKSSGALPTWMARDRLRSYKGTGLKGCRMPSPGKNRTDLRGYVSVKAKLSTGGTLQILELKATREHQPLVPCLKKEIASWQLSSKASDAGSDVSFKLYISFPRAKSAGILGMLSTKGGNAQGALVGGLGTGSGYGYGYGGLGLKGIGKRGGSGSKYTYYRSMATLTVAGASGAIDKQTVQWAVKQMGLEYEARYCHKSAANRNPGIKGTMKVKLRLNALGAVDQLEVIKASIKDAEMQQCLLRNLMRKTYPPGKSKTTIEFLFDFPKAEKG